MNVMFIDFVNSEWYDGHGRLNDRLLKRQWLGAFRRRWFSGRSSAPDEEDLHPYFRPESGPLEETRPPAGSSGLGGRSLEELRALRTLLRGIVEKAAADRKIPTAEIKQLNTFLEKADVRHRMKESAGELRLETIPLVEDDDALVGSIALSAAEFFHSGDRQRLKICGNRGCRWVFYDNSKNRSRRWCDSDLCGNLFKVRRYRSRHRTSG